jgi:hypothetical protein
MTPAQRVQAALTEIARRRVVTRATATYAPTDHRPTGPQGACCAEGAGVFDTRGGWLATVWADDQERQRRHEAMSDHIADNDPAHVLAVLDIHQQILAAVNEWLLPRLDRPAFFTDLIRAVLDLYAPELETTDA